MSPKNVFGIPFASHTRDLGVGKATWLVPDRRLGSSGIASDLDALLQSPEPAAYACRGFGDATGMGADPVTRSRLKAQLFTPGISGVSTAWQP